VTATARTPVAPPSGVARLLAGADRPPTLDHHAALFGPIDPRVDAIEIADEAAVRGRGGAAFPTAVKLRAVAGRRGSAVVVANGVEGEPASKKDISLLRVAPHLVLDGALLAANAVGADQVFLAVSKSVPELDYAVRERRQRGVEIRGVPDRFVAGEETALIRALGGRAAKPTLKPPYPSERGFDGRPTLVQNVETLAHLALLARFGPSWFGDGTALVTLGGAFMRRGVHEIPLGATLAEVVARSGGLSAPVSGYLVGGYFGRWFATTDASSLELTPDVLGAGAIVALPESTCAVAECARVVGYLADESAGQCGPCVHGLAAIADAVAEDSRRDRRPDIRRWADMVEGRGACRHPDGAARFVRSALDVFAEEFDRHVRHRGCGRRCERVLPLGAQR
jgi:NADH:ubiquinone oxidoreductase subunit F (NADH-binding)